LIEFYSLFLNEDRLRKPIKSIGTWKASKLVEIKIINHFIGTNRNNTLRTQ